MWGEGEELCVCLSPYYPRDQGCMAMGCGVERLRHERQEMMADYTEEEAAMDKLRQMKEVTERRAHLRTTRKLLMHPYVMVHTIMNNYYMI